MEESIFNMYDNIFTYNGQDIMMIIDNKGNPWFSGNEIANILKYGNLTNAITNNVQKQDKKYFSELKHFLTKIPKNSQPNAIFINETGLYYLIFGSKKDLAIQFKDWVLRTVLPSIRQYGEYHIGQKYADKLKILYKYLNDANHKIDILENNQKKQKFPDGGLVYALQPMDNIQKSNDKILVRIGKSDKMQGRWNTYNTSTPNNFKLLYYVQTEDPIAVEYCVKALLNKYKYRHNKDYYKCKLSSIVLVLDKCANAINNGKFESICETCKKDINSIKRLTNHIKKNHLVNVDDNVLEKQFGGIESSLSSDDLDEFLDNSEF